MDFAVSLRFPNFLPEITVNDCRHPVYIAAARVSAIKVYLKYFTYFIYFKYFTSS